MANNNITIVELAASLGLSKSTVSRAFTDSIDISAKTKQRVLQKAAELGFSPNVYASNLRGNKSDTIAVIIPEFGNKFFSQAIKGIEQVARSQGYHVLIYVTDHNAAKESEIIRSLINGRVDGVIISGSGEGKDHAYINLLKQNSVPMVFFDRYYDDVDTISVTGNDYESSFLATKHLLDNGSKRIAYLAIDKHVSIGKIRMDGYIDALKEVGIDIDENLILDTVNDPSINSEDIKQLIINHKPDGVFASVERLAISTLRVAFDLGINIPEDMKLICFSCLDIADILRPSLSVVKQPAFDMGKVATEYLIEILRNRQPIDVKRVIFLPSQLIFQESSRNK